HLKRPNPLQATYAKADKKPEKVKVEAYRISDQFGKEYQIERKFVLRIQAPAQVVEANNRKTWDLMLTEDNPYKVPRVRSSTEPIEFNKTFYQWVSESGTPVRVPIGYVQGISRQKREQTSSFQDDPYRGSNFEFRN
ncbi:hypothetical protein N9B94_04845, partial [Verrucomicrobia bacterium]|nr:hypothetical protein [Verrucomicrobiota bacterium]